MHYTISTKPYSFRIALIRVFPAYKYLNYAASIGNTIVGVNTGENTSFNK